MTKDTLIEDADSPESPEELRSVARMEQLTPETSVAGQPAIAQVHSNKIERIDHEDHINEVHRIERQNVSQHNDGEPTQGNGHVSNRVRAVITTMTERALPLKGQKPLVQLQDFESSQVPGTGVWLFKTNAWKAWESGDHNNPYISIQGNTGVGKSYLAFAAYQHLKAVHSCSPSSETCIVYYAALPDTSSCTSLIMGILELACQMADQNGGLRQLLEDKLKNIESVLSVSESYLEGLLQFFFYDLFPKTSNHQLFIVIDDVDEVEDDSYKNFVQDMVQRIKEEELRIKVVTTSGPDYDAGPSTAVHVSKEDIFEDLRLIVSDRLCSTDAAYRGLKRLPSSVAQQLAQTIEENADGLLYADQILRFLGNAEEDDNITRMIDAMPKNTKELLDIILLQSEKSFSQDSLARAKTLFVWLTFSKQSLFVEEFLFLVDPNNKTEAADFLRIMAQFFEIRRKTTNHSMVPVLTTPESLLPNASVGSLDSGQDWPFIQLKHRAIRKSLSKTNRSYILNLTESEGHRILFLCYVQIIRDLEYLECALYETATFHLAYHWKSIQLRDHSVEEMTEVYHAFHQLLQDERFTWALVVRYAVLGGADPTTGEVKSDLSLSRILFPECDFEKTWALWSQSAKNLPLSEEELAYWRDQNDALKPLWKTLLRTWLQVPYGKNALWLYDIAKKLTEQLGTASPVVLQKSGFKKDCKDSPENVWALANAAGLELDSDAHHAISAALGTCDIPMAIQETEKAIQMCDQPVRLTQFYLQIAMWHLRAKQWQKTLDYTDMVIGANRATILAREAPEAGPLKMAAWKEEWKWVVDRKVTDEDGNMPEHLLRRTYCQALQLKGLAQFNLEFREDATKSMTEARETHSEVISAVLLTDEIFFYANDINAPLDQLLKFAPYHQVLCLTDPVNRKATARLMCWIAGQTGRTDEVREVYQSVIKTLDKESAGAPLKVLLATIMWQLKQPIDDTKRLLSEVLDSFRALPYKYTKERPARTSFEALNLMSSILLEDFRVSGSTEEKAQITRDTKDLPNRSLPATTDMVSLELVPWQLSLARMLREVGPSSEYGQTMQQIFTAIMDNLAVSHECVNPSAVFCLGQILSMLPSFKDYAELINSVIWYKLQTDSSDVHCHVEIDRGDDEKQFDINPKIEATCDGGCVPMNKFTSWDTKMYQCLVCPNTWLCEMCYNVRTAWNSDPDSRGSLPSFCCSNGQYLAGPVKGWRGVKDGVLYLDPEEGDEAPKKIDFRQLLDDIKAAWDKHWEIPE